MTYRSMDMISTAVIAGAVGVALTGSAAERAHSTQDRALGTGVTCGNAGGMGPANLSTFGPIRTQRASPNVFEPRRAVDPTFGSIK